jgi:hypothetical protein
MKKLSIIGISLLFISAMSMLSTNLVSASTGAANFLPNYYLPPPLGPDTQTEMTLALSVAQYVTTTLANYNSPYGCYYSYESHCTASRYLSYLSTMNNYDEIMIFSKGHRGMPHYPNTNHFSLMGHYGGYAPDDAGLYNNTDIYYYTSSKNVFTFIWHCQTANNYQYGQLPLDEYGYYSMPYAFTHNRYLYQYGWWGSQVFLGWNDNVPPPPYPEQRGGSPQYEWGINPNYNYANVAGTFWYYMCNGNTVMEALNNLCYIIYGTAFGNTDLNNWLIVWGNKYLGLP